MALSATAATVKPAASVTAAHRTIEPFLILALIISASTVADRLGAFGLLSGAIAGGSGSRTRAVTSVLVFTAALSGLVNLDVAAVVAMPVALRAARIHGLSATRLPIAVAISANTASFLLPTSNLTNLLLLGRVPLNAAAYLSRSWLPWLLANAVTIAVLTPWALRGARGHPNDVAGGLSLGALSELLPLFLLASAIRSLLGTRLALHGGFFGQLLAGTGLVAGANNLPAAAAMIPAGTAGLWAAVLAATIGPNLLITGSVATLIARRIARDGGGDLSAWQLSVVGLVLVPVQLALASLGLWLTGAVN